MDGFSYHDIFATKSIEYLIIVVFFLLLIPFWIFLNRKPQFATSFSQVWSHLSASFMRIPQGLFLSGNHTWVFMEKSGSAKIGLDELLLHLTGDVSFSQLKNAGDSVQKGDLLMELHHEGKRLRLQSPVSGTILNFNATCNSISGGDPYEKGWLCEIQPSNWTEEIQTFYLGEKATAFVRNELVRFKDFISRQMASFSPETSMVVLQDGGEISDQALSTLPQSVWENFENEFLNLS